MTSPVIQNGTPAEGVPANAPVAKSPSELTLPISGPRRLKELIPAQVAAIIATDARLIVPVGTCEQHGPHLPLGTATIKDGFAALPTAPGLGIEINEGDWA